MPLPGESCLVDLAKELLLLGCGKERNRLLVLPAWSGSRTGTITLSSGYLYFGSQSVASVSPFQTLTITNNTRYQFAFTSVSAETGFSVASKNCAVLQPGQSCTVQIVFVPMHAGN